MTAHVFVVRGDLTDIRADVVVIPTSTEVAGDGLTIQAAAKRWGEEISSRAVGKATDRIKSVADCSGTRINRATSYLPQGVVLVATVGKGSAIKRPVRTAAQRAIETAQELVAKLRAEDRVSTTHWFGGDTAATSRALVAIGSLTTGKGGGSNVAAANAKEQVLGIVEALKVDPGFDVVIVTWDQDAHARFLAARENAYRDANPRDARLADLAEVAAAVERDACVLFVGAGLSAGAGLPAWDTLVGDMANTLREEGHTRVPETSTRRLNLDIAQHYAGSQGGADRHIAKIRDTYGPRAVGERPPTLAHYLLLSLPMRYVVTTNYDALVERTLRGLRVPTLKVVEDGAVSLSGEKHFVTVFKIHGDADNGRAEDIVLTASEYDGFECNHPAKVALLQALLLNHHFFFVGYSREDGNLNEVRKSVSKMLRREQRVGWATSIGPAGASQALEDRSVKPIVFRDSRALAIALDALASTSVERTRVLFGNQTEAPTELLAPLHKSLRDAADAAVALVKGSSDPFEVEAAFHTLQALAELGWRPLKGSGSRYELWVRIASAPSTGASLQQRAWRAALADAENDGQRAQAVAALATSPGISE